LEKEFKHSLEPFVETSGSVLLLLAYCQ